MATSILKMIIQFRRDTTANWEANKTMIPAAGEPCYDLDLKTLKIGDGSTSYADLPSIGGIEVDGTSLVLEEGVLKLLGFDTAEVGAQPRKKEDGTIEWVVPSTELVDALQDRVSKLETSATTLLGRVEGLETKMDGVDEGSVDAKINAKINEFATKISDDGTVNTLKELVDYVGTHGSEVQNIVNDIASLKGLVGSDPVHNQIALAIANSGHMSKVEAEDTLLSKAEAKASLKHVKYEIANVPAGTLVDYRDKEIRVMVPADAKFDKQAVGAGGDPNSYYITFKTYAPSDDAVGYIEHLGDQVDSEILTTFSTDKHGRRYQPTWLALATYDEPTDTWSYYGKNSSVSKYIGWDYQIDWYDANGVIIASDKIRINLSNETCHNNIEPFYLANLVKGVSVAGTILNTVDGIIDVPVGAGLKASDEISIATDGTLGVGTIGVSKLANEVGVTLVLDGGAAV